MTSSAARKVARHWPTTTMLVVLSVAFSILAWQQNRNAEQHRSIVATQVHRMCVESRTRWETIRLVIIGDNKPLTSSDATRYGDSPALLRYLHDRDAALAARVVELERALGPRPQCEQEH